MKKFINPVIISFFILLQSACVRYYKTSKVRQGFNKAVSSADTIRNKANSNYSKNKKIYDSVIVHIDNKEMQPYPLLRSQLAKMKSALSNLNSRRNKIVSNRTKFDNITRGQSKIQSNKPVWKQFNKIKKDFEVNIEKYKGEVKVYENSSRAYTNTANKYRITKVNTGKINGKVRKFSNRVIIVLKDTRAKINGAGINLKKLEGQGYNPKTIQGKKSILDQMRKILDKIKKINSEITVLNGEFKKEAGAMKNFWAGPGMTTHSILLKITGMGNSVKSLGSRLSSLAVEFNKKPKKKKGKK